MPGSWGIEGRERCGDSERVWEEKLLGEGGKKRGCIKKKRGGSKEEDHMKKEKRGHKKGEEVMTGQSFRENGNKGKTRQRRQKTQRERKEKRSPGVRQRKRGGRLKEI